jgi:hypothetical protein
MMPTRLKLNLREVQIRELWECVSIGSEQLASLALKLNSLQPIPIEADQLLNDISKHLDSETKAETLLRQLISLSMVGRQSENSSREVVLALRNALESEKRLPDWDGVATQFQSLLDSAPVRLVTKAMDLSYDYANVLRGTKILTDLRPLFNESGESVEGGVVTYTLRVTYSNGDSRNDISLALDMEDVLKLQDQCERAIAKSKSMQQQFIRSSERPCLISGEVEEISDE